MKIFFSVLLVCFMCLVSTKSYAIIQEDFAKIKEISDLVVAGSASDNEKVFKLSRYVHNKLKPDASKGIDAQAQMSTTDRLDSGVGWCNHQVAVFMRLAEAQNIRTRMLYLINTEGTASPHTIGEAYLGGRWVIVDPLFDINGFYSREDVSKNPNVLKNEPLIYERIKTVYGGDEKQLDKFLECFTNPALFVYELGPE